MLYLFGSRARGDNSPYSDVDLFCNIITKEELENIQPWFLNGCTVKESIEKTGHVGIIDLYHYSYYNQNFQSMCLFRIGLGRGFKKPLWQSIFEEARPIAIQEIINICRKVESLIVEDIMEKRDNYQQYLFKKYIKEAR